MAGGSHTALLKSAFPCCLSIVTILCSICEEHSHSKTSLKKIRKEAFFKKEDSRVHVRIDER